MMALERESPESFKLPPVSRRRNLQPGELAKLIFRFEWEDADEAELESMWVEVTEHRHGGYRGILDQDPYCTNDLRTGDRVEFGPQHVIEIWEGETVEEDLEEPGTRDHLEKGDD